MRPWALFLLIFLALLMMAPTPLWAFNYIVKCNSQRELTEISTVPNSESPAICSSYAAEGFPCFDTHRGVENPKSIFLGSPIRNFYAPKKRSELFLRSAVNEVIETSLDMGVDPYAVLAIVILENAPTPGHQAYASDYGNPPIDVGTFRQVWNCTLDGSPQGPTPVFQIPPGPDARPKKMMTWLCEDTEVGEKKWQSPTLHLGKKDDTCCARVFHYEKDEYDLMRKVKGLTAMTYIKNYFRGMLSSEVVAKTKPRAEKLSMLLQAYNGYGTLGNSEGIMNQCLRGLQMKKEPLYGAGAADLMLNFLMANSEVREMVHQALVYRGKTTTPSYLCQAYGEGFHFIHPLEFSNLQYQFLSSRQKCLVKPYDFEGVVRNPRAFDEGTMKNFKENP